MKTLKNIYIKLCFVTIDKKKKLLLTETGQVNNVRHRQNHSSIEIAWFVSHRRFKEMWESICLTLAATAGNNIGKVLQKKGTIILPPLSLKLKVSLNLSFLGCFAS